MFNPVLAEVSFASWLYPWVLVQLIESSLLLGSLRPVVVYSASGIAAVRILDVSVGAHQVDVAYANTWPHWIARYVSPSMTRQWIQPSQVTPPTTVESELVSNSDYWNLQRETLVAK